MAIATFICKNCNLSKQIMFKPGKVDKPVCDKCGKEMQREWKKIETKENYYYAQDQVDKGIVDHILTDYTSILV